MSQTPIRSHGPQMAKVMPAPAWMFTNSVCPSGLNVDPANSSSERVLPSLATSRLRAMSQSCPPRESPRMKLSLIRSSHTTSVPRGLVVMLSGKSRTFGPGDSYTSWRVCERQW